METLLQAVSLQRSSVFKLSRIILCSDDDELKESFEERTSVLFISQEKRWGKPDSLNRLMEASSAEFCIHNSADCIPASEYSYHFLLKPLLDPRVGAVSGHPIPVNHGFLGLPVVVWKCHDFVQPKLSGEMFSFSRRLFSPIPADVVHDDTFLHHEIVRKGFNVVFEPRAAVFNSVPETFREFYAQRKKNVMGNLQFVNEFRERPLRAMRLRALIMMGLEVIVNVHGKLDYVRGKTPKGLIGYSLKSTKEVRSQMPRKRTQHEGS